MHQARVDQWGKAPKPAEAPEPAAPAADEVRIKVQAVGVHRVVRTRASGAHYSSGDPPHVPGMDGIGTTEDGRTVYWASFDVGAMSQYINVDKRRVRELPAGIDPLQAAAITNPAMSSWMAIKSRTSDLPADFTALILGATSASGRVAIPLLRVLGAKKVIGAARNESALAGLGLDATVVVQNKPEETDFSKLGEVDVVLDYVYGPLAVHLFRTFRQRAPMQYVHVGGLSGEEDISLPGALLRSKNLTIRGSGPGAWGMQQVAASLDDILAALKHVPEQPVKVVQLTDVEAAWAEEGNERLVVSM
ncbi:hypothetical protein LTR08_004181 [Meristemomyces frigidus]|nr:hypothetical protein LTR08_004181 [Meristemomyces frigidus]